jgi:hypothetical protein
LGLIVIALDPGAGTLPFLVIVFASRMLGADEVLAAAKNRFW